MRNTRDVDILLREEDIDRASAALTAVGFVRDSVMDVIVFLDGPEGKPSQGIRVLRAGLKVKQEYVSPAPDVALAAVVEGKPIVQLTELVRMKLNSFRDKDRTHLRAMIGVGLIDGSWPQRFEKPLGARLQELLDNPEG